jgi:serine protease AprX
MEQGIEASALSPGSMYNVVDQVGARDAWAAGITGAGVNVAVIDTGVAPVDALAGKIVAQADLSSEASDPSTRFVDTFGHGTAMAGIIAGVEPGADPATAADHPEKFLGVAPDAGIVSVKISGRDGTSNPADVVAGIDWVIANAEDLDIKVINLAYSSGSPLSYVDDPLTSAVERAWNAGIAVVAIAGNDGNDTQRLASPGIDPYIITVAGAEATESGIEIGSFSNGGDGTRNPDIAAPGAHIESLRAPGSDADLNHSDVGTVDGDYVDEMLFKGTGTSQSAAVTSGVLALLYQANPGMTPDQAKAVLMSTAEPIAGSATSAGASLVRADLAVAAQLPDVEQTWAPAIERPATDVSAVPAEFGGAHWGGAHWGGAHWGGAHWGGAHWGGAHWGGAHWGGAHWGGAHWGGAHWG